VAGAVVVVIGWIEVVACATLVVDVLTTMLVEVVGNAKDVLVVGWIVVVLEVGLPPPPPPPPFPPPAVVVVVVLNMEVVEIIEVVVINISIVVLLVGSKEVLLDVVGCIVVKVVDVEGFSQIVPGSGIFKGLGCVEIGSNKTSPLVKSSQ